MHGLEDMQLTDKCASGGLKVRGLPNFLKGASEGRLKWNTVVEPYLLWIDLHGKSEPRDTDAQWRKRGI